MQASKDSVFSVVLGMLREFVRTLVSFYVSYKVCEIVFNASFQRGALFFPLIF